MDPFVVKRILEVQDAAREDERYMGLLAEYRCLGKRYAEILPTLQKEQREVVVGFLGLVFEMHLRMLEIACSLEGDGWRR